MKYFIFFICSALCINYGLAQDQKKKNKDFFNIKAPAIEYSSLDTTEILFEEEFTDDSEAAQSTVFRPEKELNIVSEDTSTIGEGEVSIVEVSEQLKMDSNWVTIAEYFSIWDSKNINPYRIDGSKFKDTLRFQLYDSLSGFNWSMPLKNCLSTSEFGMRWQRWHYGTDLALNTGDKVFAAFDGIVRVSHFDKGGYGNFVMIRHYNGFETLYGHFSRSKVKVGQLVKSGEMIGLGGSTGKSTGPHLHFEVRFEGNAIDPEFIFDFDTKTLRTRIFDLNPEHFEYLRESARKIISHRVRPGDTVYSISRKYRVSVKDICRLNSMEPKDILKVGRRLRIR